MAPSQAGLDISGLEWSPSFLAISHREAETGVEFTNTKRKLRHGVTIAAGGNKPPLSTGILPHIVGASAKVIAHDQPEAWIVRLEYGGITRVRSRAKIAILNGQW